MQQFKAVQWGLIIMAMQRRNSAQNYYYFGLLLVGVVFSAVSRRSNRYWSCYPWSSLYYTAV